MDRDRPRRVGIPEVVLGEGKTVAHLLEILSRLHAEGMGALVSRPTPSQRTAIARAARDGLPTKELAGGRLIRLAGPLGAD
jgi:NCAIR mutase (PurE)-related protein